MKLRRHHNNTGLRQIKRGKTARQVQRIAARLGILSKAQKALAQKHGTPAEFAAAVYRAVPSDISMDEADAAISKYNREWADAQ